MKESTRKQIGIAAFLALVFSLNSCPKTKEEPIGNNVASHALAMGTLELSTIKQMTLYRLPQGTKRIDTLAELRRLPRVVVKDSSKIQELLSAIRKPVEVTADMIDKFDPKTSMNGVLNAELTNGTDAVVFLWVGPSLVWITPPSREKGRGDTYGTFSEAVYEPIIELFDNTVTD